MLHQVHTGIITFEHTYIIEILTTRETVKSRQRIIVISLRHHILVILKNITGTGIECHLVFQETGRVTDSEIIAVVSTVGQYIGGVGSRSRQIRLILLVTG